MVMKMMMEVTMRKKNTMKKITVSKFLMMMSLNSSKMLKNQSKVVV